MSDARDVFAELDELVTAGMRVTFSAYCRSGWIGDRCRCWRCRGEPGPAADESAAARDAAIMDRAYERGVEMGRVCERARKRVAQDFEADTEEDVKAQVEAWARTEVARIVALLEDDDA